MRLDRDKDEQVDDPKIDAFIEDVIAVCMKHGLSLGHEDGHGAFIVYRRLEDFAFEWLRAAHVEGGLT